MTSKQQETGLTILKAVGIIIVIVKIKNILSPSFNPTDTTQINSVWNLTPAQKAKVKFTYSLRTDDYIKLAQDIYQSLGVVEDNWNDIYTAITQCSTQGDVYGVCNRFEAVYNANLWESITNGFGLFPWSGISNSQAKQLNDYVSSLPL